MQTNKTLALLFIALTATGLSGCAMVEIAMVGAGRSATAEDTGFMQSYEGLSSESDPAHPNLPDLYAVVGDVKFAGYKKVLMPDFTSLTTDISKLGGLQVRQYKNIKKDLPDQIANTLDGSVFTNVVRLQEKVDPKDMAAIKKLPATAVLMGNIKELVSLGGENDAGLTAIQVEYKLVEVKTGREVLRAIHRSTTDLDKVPMAQVRVLSGLIDKGKASAAAAP
jgi:hypothetical protein